MKYEQAELDLRLDWERDMDENIEVLVSFAYRVLMNAQEGNMVKNRHEGYGLLAEQYVNVTAALKGLKDDMAAYLKILPIDDFKAVDAVANIDGSLHKLIVAAVCMAAQAKRISDELYTMTQSVRSPLEEYAESQEEGDFEEVAESEDE
jgi:hypothetical protein